LLAALTEEAAGVPGDQLVMWAAERCVEARASAWRAGAHIWELYAAATGANLGDFTGLPNDYPQPADHVRAARHALVAISAGAEAEIVAAQTAQAAVQKRYDDLYAQAVKAVIAMRNTGYWPDPEVVKADNWPDKLEEVLDYAKDRVLELFKIQGQRDLLEQYMKANWTYEAGWADKTVLEVAYELLQRYRALPRGRKEAP
jgi:hypothetical protein